MSSLLFLIPIALLLLGVALWAFVWAVDHRQFDDLDEVAERILFDDDEARVAPRSGADEPDEHV